MPRNRKSIEKEQLSVQKKMLDVLKENLFVGKEHKDISKKQLNSSLDKGEQRFYSIASIVIMTILGVLGLGIIHLLTLGSIGAIKDYNVNVIVSPDKVLLNEKQDIDFTFTFTNNGLKNISDFSLLGLYVYRIEDGKPVFKDGLIYPFSNPIPSCNPIGWYNADTSTLGTLSLPVGKSCTVNVKMTQLAYTSFLDDKDKQVQFYIYIKSTPPIGNKVLNLSIY